jgi:hypothetical protein
MTCFDIVASFALSASFVPPVGHHPQCVRDYASISDRETCRLAISFATELSAGEIVILAGGDAKLPIHYKNDLSYYGEGVNLSHWIDHVGFGPKFSGIQNPLDQTALVEEKVGFFVHDYRLRLVKSYSEELVESNQYAALLTEKEIVKVVTKRRPRIAISFESSPFAVKLVRQRVAIGEIAMEIVAVVGGGFALFRICDLAIWKLMRKGRPRA